MALSHRKDNLLGAAIEQVYSLRAPELLTIYVLDARPGTFSRT